MALAVLIFSDGFWAFKLKYSRVRNQVAVVHFEMTNMKFKSWTDSRQTEAQLITTQQQPLDLNETDYISKQGAYLLPRFKKK